MRQGKNENLSEEEQMKVIEDVIKTKIEINELDCDMSINTSFSFC